MAFLWHKRIGARHNAARASMSSELTTDGTERNCVSEAAISPKSCRQPPVRRGVSAGANENFLKIRPGRNMMQNRLVVKNEGPFHYLKWVLPRRIWGIVGGATQVKRKEGRSLTLFAADAILPFCLARQKTKPHSSRRPKFCVIVTWPSRCFGYRCKSPLSPRCKENKGDELCDCPP